MIDASTREAGGGGGKLEAGGRFHYTEHASKCQRASVRGGRFNSWGRGEMTGVEPVADLHPASRMKGHYSGIRRPGGCQWLC